MSQLSRECFLENESFSIERFPPKQTECYCVLIFHGLVHLYHFSKFMVIDFLLDS